MAEMIDIFDASFRHLGTCERDEAHEAGLWHQSFHCWIASNSEGVPKLLFQLRGSGKKTHPNLLDVTVGGHLGAGESKRDGLRELEEELGVVADYGRLLGLGLRIEVCDEGKLRNREFVHAFILRDDRAPGSYRLQAEELDGLFELPVADAVALFEGKADRVKAAGVRFVNGRQAPSTMEFGREDFVPRFDGYYLKMLDVALRFIGGETRLFV